MIGSPQFLKDDLLENLARPRLELHLDLDHATLTRMKSYHAAHERMEIESEMHLA